MAIQVREQSRGRARAGGELAAALRAELRGAVRADPYTRHLYASDASMYARDPLLVAFPRDAADVAAAIAIAGHFDVPVITRGAGTSLAGQTVGAGGLVLDTSRHMDAIGEIDTEQRRVRVGPGVVQEDLNRAAHRLGFGFGPDTSTSNRATIGGMIGNNSSGSHSIVYGTTIDHVHELDVVLADGATATLGPDAGPERLKDGLREILRDHAGAIETGYPKHWRQSGGYRLDYLARDFNLAKLVTGSEGTLVAITEATVGLVPLPRARLFAVGHFHSLAAAIAATEDALELNAAAIEMIDRTILELSRSKHEYRALSQTIEGDPAALLFVTFFGDTVEEARHKLDTLERSWATHGHGYHTLRAESPQEQEAMTKVRKAGLGLLMAASTGARRPLAFVEDTAVAPERLNDYVAAFKQILDRHDLNAGWYGHCSVGCLHIRPFVDLTEPGGIETMSAVAEEIVDLVAAFDGVNSSEHGDGRVRSAFNRRIFGDELYEAFREVKALFDPHNRLNPGVMVEAAPLTEGLRDPALPPPGLIETHLHFPDGMRAAADRCQRIGACRKTGHRRHVPVVHGHARGGARHARARERARQGALGTRSGTGARRRAAARDPRPVPRVQGVQERVPAERRHGVAEGGVPQPLPGCARGAAAVTAVRLDPCAQPDRRGHRAALQPRPATAARARRRHRPPPPASALPARHADPLGQAPHQGRRARGRLPRRLVHDLHGAGDRACRDRAARGGRAMPCGSSRPGAAGARASPRACSTGRARWRRA